MTDATHAQDPANQNAPRRFLDGRLLLLDAAAAAEIKNGFSRRIEKLVDEAFALADDVQETPELRQAATEYAVACSRTRHKLPAKTLAGHLAEGTDTLVYLTEAQLDAQHALDHALQRYLSRQAKTEKPKFTARITRLMHTFAIKSKQQSGKIIDTLPWDDKGRLYFRLEDNSQSPAEAVITAYLAERGYTVTDYANGRARDNRRNEWKIGKLLKDNPGLLEAFYDDPAIQSKNLMVVVTRDVGDLARGSYQRGWQSCRASAEAAARHAAEEAQVGVMSAYLVSQNDPDIHSPLARINIKPYMLEYRTEEGMQAVTRDTALYAPFTPIGLHHAGFADAVARWAEETFNRGLPAGIYRLPAGCESYKEFKIIRRLPQEPEAALQAIAADYRRDENGKLVVTGDLSLRGFGLTRLPDFSAVTVEGGIDVAQNKLLTLEGLPQNQRVSHLNASGNLLVCFAGAGSLRVGEFDYRDNAWLMTGHDAPQADAYQYGNNENGSKRRHASAGTCVTPTESREHFPRFKRR